YNYLYARHHGGTFVLRIEDTDQTRYVEDAEQDIITSLEWAGMTIDEGPHAPGEFGPYRQSERKAMYHEYAKQLIESGNAYYAFDTTEEIDEMRERLKKSGNPSPKYDSITRQSMKNSLTLPQDEVEKRLEKLRSAPERDRQRMLELQPLWQKFWRRCESPGSCNSTELHYFRWLLEELRVSLFAQELGTVERVSVPRLEKQWKGL
ncbi:MAG: DUF3418 domain-containing protein, partial [Gammaproteobacteria bacterium]|nr:DUF3418 domain-containing protein [Gammaproteobacteria bacterium]